MALVSAKTGKGLGFLDDEPLLPVRHQETLTALLHFIGRMCCFSRNKR